MRTRERLIEVLRSANRRIVGGYTLQMLAATIAGDANAPFVPSYAANVCRSIIAVNASPHFRELAEEALHYLRGGENV